VKFFALDFTRSTLDRRINQGGKITSSRFDCDRKAAVDDFRVGTI